MRLSLFATASVAFLAAVLPAACSSSSSPSGSGGSGGSGGSAEGGSCTASESDLVSLGFSTACNTCIASKCCENFATCEGDADCTAELKCVSACYLKTGDLETCATTTCVDDTDAGHNDAHAIVFCVLDSCGTAETCMLPSGG